MLSSFEVKTETALEWRDLLRHSYVFLFEPDKLEIKRH